MALKDNLILYWKLDDLATPATDSFDTHQGNISGATYTASGKINGAYSHDGTGDYIMTNKDLDPITMSFPITIMGWAKSTASGGTIISYALSSATDKYMLIGIDAVNKPFIFARDASNYTTGTAAGVLDQNWHHIVGVFNSNTSKDLYVDGISGASISVSRALASENRIAVGTNGRSNLDGRFTGVIDECAVWNRAITTAEISEIYNSGSGLPYSSWDAAAGTNAKININDAWKTIAALKINIGDAWKTFAAAKLNIGDAWKTLF